MSDLERYGEAVAERARERAGLAARGTNAEHPTIAEVSELMSLRETRVRELLGQLRSIRRVARHE
jgi:hypothetical protein